MSGERKSHIFSRHLFERHCIGAAAAIFCLLAMILIVAYPQISSANDKGRRSKNNREFKLGDVDLRVTDTRDGGFLLRFSSNGEEVFKGECAFKTQDPEITRNVPGPGCRSLLVNCFSGGAHCCTTLLIATECDHKTSIDAVDMAHSDLREKFINVYGAPGKLLRVYDWQFAYYAPEDSQIQLAFSNSPAMARLLVYENGHWRADRIGEFREYYSNLFRQIVRKAKAGAVKNEPESATSLAIKAAYYNIMAGNSREQATEVLTRLLPAQWKTESEKVIADIQHAASEFNPIELIR